MPQFNNTSNDRLNTCDPRLRMVMHEVIRRVDCSILCGTRGKAEQNRLYELKRTQKLYPDSKHNSFPSLAVDVQPWPRPKEKKDWYVFAGYVLGVAAAMGITLRWGGDWNGNMLVSDNGFDDLAHFEIVE